MLLSVHLCKKFSSHKGYNGMFSETRLEIMIKHQFESSFHHFFFYHNCESYPGDDQNWDKVYSNNTSSTCSQKGQTKYQITQEPSKPFCYEYLNKDDPFCVFQYIYIFLKEAQDCRTQGTGWEGSGHKAPQLKCTSTSLWLICGYPMMKFQNWPTCLSMH